MELSSELIKDVLTWQTAIGAGTILILWIAWALTIGSGRATMAIVCRIAWLAPLFLSFFPATETEQLPRTLSLRPVHVLIDDSDSMRQAPDSPADSPLARAEVIAKEVEGECARLGCIPKFTRLSEQDDSTRQGYTPLSKVFDSWIYRVGAEPWLLVSDGGDSMPMQRWPNNLRGVGAPVAKSQTPRGLIVGVKQEKQTNIWIKDTDIQPFAFEDKPLVFTVNLMRSAPDLTAERIQLQVLNGDVSLANVNAEFSSKSEQAQVTVTLPALPRGQHLLTVRALPTPNEAALWDNTVYVQTEVLPNTVGVLHLLGSPSWDGRFLRRYLKAEPKYDLISFFILRDPWDTQNVNERELSLIPFPVERLFREELSHFRVVIVQNFTLLQFLLPEYQRNLVKFVQDGGGLLFVGGPRALTASDLSSSPLRDILPFEVKEGEYSPGPADFSPFGDDFLAATPTPGNDTGPSYDPNLAFRIEMAKPEPAKRALANVYEDWDAISGPLTSWKNAKGLHHMERVQLKTATTTVLLNAKADGKDIPLAVASYPGKGRALWIFSDALWRLGLTPSPTTSRQVYNQFMQGAMTWLMRQDLRRPLVATNFTLRGGQRVGGSWRVTIQGPAARYFQQSPDWRLTVCGHKISADELIATKHSDEEWEIGGALPQGLANNQRCTLEVEGEHAAFGSVKASVTAAFPEIYKDKEIGVAPQKLEELAKVTGAALSFLPSGPGESLQQWLAAATDSDGVVLPSRFKTLRNFYWILDTSWVWLLLLGLPLEVVIRRWDQIVGGPRVAAD
ncbi:MAG: hypothetical protein NTY08_01170 [Proteobacteria bacterium]|nr:hypothetical protein [Pseudomonadota bacterium]